MHHSFKRLKFPVKRKYLLRFSGIIMVFVTMGFCDNSEPVRILPLGDSITQGGKRDRQEYTYRLPLQKILHGENIHYDFIGSQNQGLHKDATWPVVAPGVAFDPDHDGYYGNTTMDACRKAMMGYASYQIPPDIILVHLGTNDQRAGNYEKRVGEPLREMIRFFRDKNPSVVVLLGHLNFNDSSAALKIREVVENLAAEMNSEESPVITVHHYKNWNEKPGNLYSDTFDWAHPNLKGQEKMALNWWESMKAYLP